MGCEFVYMRQLTVKNKQSSEPCLHAFADCRVEVLGLGSYGNDRNRQMNCTLFNDDKRRISSKQLLTVLTILAFLNAEKQIQCEMHLTNC